MNQALPTRSKNVADFVKDNKIAAAWLLENEIAAREGNFTGFWPKNAITSLSEMASEIVDDLGPENSLTLAQTIRRYYSPAVIDFRA